jgi:hypothetical protein
LSLALLISIISGSFSLLSLSLSIALYRRLSTKIEDFRGQSIYIEEETPGGTHSELNIEESSAVHVDNDYEREYWREVEEQRAI